MKKILVIFIALGMLLAIQSVKAKPLSDDVVSNLMYALVKKDEKLARAYVSSEVKIPEIRENTPITGFSGLPSPKKNVMVSIAYFSAENNSERIAFIWEVTSNKEKITNIRVVYDGSNPFMNESKARMEYEAKNKTNVLYPSKFPFDITHISGDVNKEVLMLRYRNADLGGLLQIKIVPHNTEVETLKGENDEFYSLKNGTNALYQPNFPAASQLVFRNGNLRYSIGISYATKDFVPVDDLLKVANSMFLN